MKSILKQSLKLFTMCMAVAVTFTLSQSAAQAQPPPLTVDGSTAGSTFTPGGNNLGGLSFTGTPFGGTTDANGTLEINNMGTLTINTNTVENTGETIGTFTLELDFNLPKGVFGNPLHFNGNVIASYTNENNFALIDFPDERQFAFFGGDGSGEFSIQLHDVCLSGGETCTIGEIFAKLRRQKSLNALAFNTQSGDGNVKFLKAKGSSSMFAPQQIAPQQTFTITATIRIFPACATCEPFDPTPQLVPPPTNEDQCKNDEWKNFNNPSFKNQGDCVSFIKPQ